MTIGEKAAYLRGLAEGKDLGLNEEGKKVFDAMLDLLTDMAEMVEICDEDLDSFADEFDILDQEVGGIEEDLDAIFEFLDYEDDDEDFDFEDECECHHHHGPHDHHHHHDHGHCHCGCEDDLFDDEDECYYDIDCPNCGMQFTVTEDTILTGSVVCPGCEEKLEFDFDCCDCDCDDDCCCCEDEDED